MHIDWCDYCETQKQFGPDDCCLTCGGCFGESKEEIEAVKAEEELYKNSAQYFSDSMRRVFERTTAQMPLRPEPNRCDERAEEWCAIARYWENYAVFLEGRLKGALNGKNKNTD